MLFSIFMEFHTPLFELKKDCRALNASRYARLYCAGTEPKTERSMRS